MSSRSTLLMCQMCLVFMHGYTIQHRRFMLLCEFGVELTNCEEEPTEESDFHANYNYLTINRLKERNQFH